MRPRRWTPLDAVAIAAGAVGFALILCGGLYAVFALAAML